MAKKGLMVLNGDAPFENPVASVCLERENNTRNRVLSWEEFDRLLAAAPMHLKPILLAAWYTGMRWGELLKLTWDRGDLKAGVMQLRPEDTKTQEGRIILLTNS